MKRTISFILALCLVLSLLPMGVLAAAPKVTFTVTADRSNAAVGDTITFTVSIGKVENLHGMLFELDIPEGLTYINGSAQVSNRLKSEFDFGEASFAEKTKIFVAATNSAVTLSGDTELMSFQCTVNGKASGALELGLSVEEEDVFDWEYCTIPFEIVSARVNVTKKADVVFTVSADRAKAVPGDTITYAVYISPVPDIHGVCFELDIPEGLSFVAGSSAVPENLMGQLNFGEASFAESTLVFVGVTNSETALTGETLLMSFQCKVDEGVLGQRTVGLKILEEDVFDIKYNNLPFATVAAAVQIHSHIWADATCTDPKTCSVCGETTGNALGHKWSDATCTEPKTCTRCGLTEGNALGHKWSDATCTEPKTCTRCGLTEGNALGHKWSDATCTEPKTCSVCGETTGSALGHKWSDATCTDPKTCSVCGETTGNALGHKWSNATCTDPKTCSVCGETTGNALGHKWNDATCTEPKTCSVCGETSGNALGHKWSDATCTDPKTCSVCGETSGNDLGHKWSDATCTDPKTCSVCGATTGSALGHKWTEATCTDPKTCSVCGETYGSALGHSWSAVTCTEPATCTICGTTSGSALGHRWADATCVNPKTCTICGTTDGEALGHDWLDATCTEPMICSVCHTIVGNALGHSFGETVVHVPTPGVQGYSEHTCTACGFNEKFDFVDFQGVTVSGKLDSYLGHGEVTIELIRDGEVVRTVVVNGAKEYSITDVEAGAYTLRVSKEKHAAMEYEITVGGENVSVDAKICPIGDVTGDGVVNIKDFQRLLRHVNKTNPLSGYELACGDVTGDGVCNIKDFQRLLRHVNKTNPLY